MPAAIEPRSERKLRLCGAHGSRRVVGRVANAQLPKYRSGTPAFLAGGAAVGLPPRILVGEPGLRGVPQSGRPVAEPRHASRRTILRSTPHAYVHALVTENAELQLATDKHR